MALLSVLLVDLKTLLPVMVEAAVAVSIVAFATWLISLYLDRVSVANVSAPLMILAAVLAVANSSGSANSVSMVLVAMVATIATSTMLTELALPDELATANTAASIIRGALTLATLTLSK